MFDEQYTEKISLTRNKLNPDSDFGCLLFTSILCFSIRDMISPVTPGKWAFYSKNDNCDKNPYINVMGHCYTSAGFKTHFRGSHCECICFLDYSSAPLLLPLLHEKQHIQFLSYKLGPC